jgi:plasmid stabilization system protein ParE
MKFRVILARNAAREIEEQYDWLAERSEASALRWKISLLDAIETLEHEPNRCPEAPEGQTPQYSPYTF